MSVYVFAVILTDIFYNHIAGLLHVGDIIKEINGQEVLDPDHLQDLMRKATGSITLKILPSYHEETGQSQVGTAPKWTFEDLTFAVCQNDPLGCKGYPGINNMIKDSKV